MVVGHLKFFKKGQLNIPLYSQSTEFDSVSPSSSDLFFSSVSIPIPIPHTQKEQEPCLILMYQKQDVLASPYGYKDSWFYMLCPPLATGLNRGTGGTCHRHRDGKERGDLDELYNRPGQGQKAIQEHQE